MNRPRALTVLVSSLIAACPLSQSVTAADAPAREPIEMVISDVFEPSANAFAEASLVLQQALQQGCSGQATQVSFIQAVAAFSAVEYYRIGPLNQDNRAERVFFWPDRKGTGDRQVRRLLSDPAAARLDAEQLAGKSVAVQGLPALERILFGAAPPSSDACALAQAIAQNIMTIAGEVQAGWRAADGIASQLVTHTPESVFRSPQESVAAVLTLATSAMQSITDQKLAVLFDGLASGPAIAPTAPFVRSGQTLANLAGNLQSLARLLVDSGLAASVSGQVADQVAFETDTMLSMLNAAEAAIEAGDADTATSRLKAVQGILSNLQALVKGSIAPGFGVSTGFNAGDGD